MGSPDEKLREAIELGGQLLGRRVPAAQEFPYAAEPSAGFELSSQILEREWGRHFGFDVARGAFLLVTVPLEAAVFLSPRLLLDHLLCP
jgi:hypothetical protein